MRALSAVRGLACRFFSTGDTQTRCRSKSAANDIVRPASEIPGPKPLPLLGTILLHRPGGEFYDENRVRIGFKVYQKHGPIVREKLLNRYITHVFHAEDIEKVLRNEGSYPWRITLDAITHYRKQKGLSIGLAQLQGKEWFRIRSQVQTHMLRPRTVASYLPEQAAVAEDLVTRMRRLRDERNYVTNLIKELNHWAMECTRGVHKIEPSQYPTSYILSQLPNEKPAIGVVCFNARVGALEPDLTYSREAKEFVEAVNGVFRDTYTKVYGMPTYKIFHDKAYRQFARHMDVISSLSEKHIKLTGERAKGDGPGGMSHKENLLLDLLNRPQLSRDETNVHITDLFFSGIDTTSSLLAFSLYHIATNPHIQGNLQKEIDEKLPRGVPLTEKAFSRMQYLKAVVKEASRITPVVSANVRKLGKDIVIRGYNVPVGDLILLWTSLSSISPLHFEDPKTFLPERWLRETKSRDLHPFAMLPFGFGPRMCVGRRFAEQGIYLAITKLLEEFNIDHTDGPIGMKTHLFNTPAKPLNLHLHDRV